MRYVNSYRSLAQSCNFYYKYAVPVKKVSDKVQNNCMGKVGMGGYFVSETKSAF